MKIKIKNLLFIIFCGVLFSLTGAQTVEAQTTITCYTNCNPNYTNVVGTYTLDLQCNASSPTSYTASLTVNGVSGGVNTKACACAYTGLLSWAPACSVTGSWSATHGGTATVVNTATGYTGSQNYSCSNGAWSLANSSCTPNSCSLPWGGSITSGTSATAYQSASVVSPATCASQSRLCTNGTLSGTYTNQNCTVTSSPAPSAPTISGPTTLVTGTTGTYSFVSTDPQGDQLSYAVDWNSDGTDLWMPYGSVPPPGGMTYVNSGVSQSASKAWSTPGTYTVRVLAQDIMGNNSAWTTYTITVADPQPCTAGVVDAVGSWAPTCSTSATCLTPPDPVQLTNQPGIQTGICPTPEYTGTAYRACSTATITCNPATSCGDNICNGSETILTCPADCKGKYQQF